MFASELSFAVGQQPGRQPAERAARLPGAGLINRFPPFLANVAVDHENGVYKAGDKLSVEFRADREAYLYLLYHQADGQTFLLFPNKAYSKNLVPAKQTVSIPAPGLPFRFRVRKPFGLEVIQVLAATRPIPEFDRLDMRSGKAPAVSAQLIKQLQTRLARDPTLWTEHRVPVRTFPADVEPPTRKPIRVGLFIGVGRTRATRKWPTRPG